MTHSSYLATHHADLGDSAANAIDFEFLSRQSLGDSVLEHDLLMLFDRRAADLLAQIGSISSCAARADAIHSLRGSALAVGAHGVSRAAAHYESAVRRGEGDAAVVLAHDELARAVNEARREIARRFHHS
jgi:hypothetical protein